MRSAEAACLYDITFPKIPKTQEAKLFGETYTRFAPCFFGGERAIMILPDSPDSIPIISDDQYTRDCIAGEIGRLRAMEQDRPIEHLLSYTKFFAWRGVEFPIQGGQHLKVVDFRSPDVFELTRSILDPTNSRPPAYRFKPGANYSLQMAVLHDIKYASQDEVDKERSLSYFSEATGEDSPYPNNTRVLSADKLPDDEFELVDKLINMVSHSDEKLDVDIAWSYILKLESRSINENYDFERILQFPKGKNRVIGNILFLSRIPSLALPILKKISLEPCELRCGALEEIRDELDKRINGGH